MCASHPFVLESLRDIAEQPRSRNHGNNTPLTWKMISSEVISIIIYTAFCFIYYNKLTTFGKSEGMDVESVDTFGKNGHSVGMGT